ncbi:uncharacterized protein LOC127258752 [Andrographis paniculata]|uniref:uncharacterized protein LOC127258752 n=1 Tax=Andrographis paniculata TaxID=175694 RepID=UPI0021E88378|nr:uncharacterized protein LOC127258752 [Andrographis paniculata]
MVRGGGTSERDEKRRADMAGRNAIKGKKKMKRNLQRLGGKGGLSLESFANAKTRNDNYNPAMIKKKREFYRNAKYVQKYKKSLKQQEHQNIPSASEGPRLEGENQNRTTGHNYRNNEMYESSNVNKNTKGKKNRVSLKEIYEKKHEEEEKARAEREAMIEARKEAQMQSESRRKSLKEKMFKKTKSGQPVMKYRLEHILETLQGS